MRIYEKPQMQSFYKDEIMQFIINAASCPSGTTFTCGTTISYSSNS